MCWESGRKDTQKKKKKKREIIVLEKEGKQINLLQDNLHMIACRRSNKCASLLVLVSTFWKKIKINQPIINDLKGFLTKRLLGLV